MADRVKTQLKKAKVKKFDYINVSTASFDKAPHPTFAVDIECNNKFQVTLPEGCDKKRMYQGGQMVSLSDFSKMIKLPAHTRMALMGVVLNVGEKSKDRSGQPCLLKARVVDAKGLAVSVSVFSPGAEKVKFRKNHSILLFNVQINSRRDGLIGAESFHAELKGKVSAPKSVVPLVFKKEE